MSYEFKKLTVGDLNNQLSKLNPEAEITVTTEDYGETTFDLSWYAPEEGMKDIDSTRVFINPSYTMKDNETENN